ncbi:MAG TPA: hypothetical protein VER55_04800 [Ardenticatenaceae bacterium]|nr:hypothetical protein [Ardenticatenaceae bacterium]
MTSGTPSRALPGSILGPTSAETQAALQEDTYDRCNTRPPIAQRAGPFATRLHLAEGTVKNYVTSIL